jgi:hypothetical protein
MPAQLVYSTFKSKDLETNAATPVRFIFISLLNVQRIYKPNVRQGASHNQPNESIEVDVAAILQQLRGVDEKKRKNSLV